MLDKSFCCNRDSERKRNGNNNGLYKTCNECVYIFLSFGGLKEMAREVVFVAFHVDLYGKSSVTILDTSQKNDSHSMIH